MAFRAANSDPESILQALNQQDISDKDRWRIIADAIAKMQQANPDPGAELRITREIEELKKENQELNIKIHALELSAVTERSESKAELTEKIDQLRNSTFKWLTVGLVIAFAFLNAIIILAGAMALMSRQLP